MGVYEHAQLVMHWQHDRYVGPAHDPSRDLSPNLPIHSCDPTSMGDVEPRNGNTSNCSTPNSGCAHLHRPLPPCNNNCETSLCRAPFDGPRQHRGGPSGSFSDCDAFTPPLLHPKLEQHPNPGTPSTPPTSADDVVVCAGCAHRISDRFYLLAVDRRWHASCLQCCQCRQTLDGETKCYAREGNIYCKKDYYRLFGMKRCARCQAAILFTEMVMRARDLVFHVQCFTCAVCNSTFNKGDQFGLKDSTVLCQIHYEQQQHQSPSPVNFPGGSTYPPPFPSPEFHPHHHPPSAAPACADSVISTKVPYFNGSATGATRQKGRPRKRKPKDLEAMTANLDLNADYLDVPFGRSGPGTPGLPGSNGQQRTKRMRTSFKHHQLRTMKSYFAINHNPDAKDLKQLSQKTGLPKRVLQVWFQNARAKWRRMMIKQEGKTGDKCPGAESGNSLGDMETFQPHAPGTVGPEFHQQSLPPHSPPFVLGGSSSSPLECS
ncbi:protein apterous isoform X2 [Cryptotermes secundus]|uniref:protein apterous isoform X2 n=1 Tax=Cryptotermes secundus TaxID=105785 RepID=UPI000CD7CD11|nr:protein apterous isoform X2 [Cryptotermes secundus]